MGGALRGVSLVPDMGDCTRCSCCCFPAHLPLRHLPLDVPFAPAPCSSFVSDIREQGPFSPFPLSHHLRPPPQPWESTQTLLTLLTHSTGLCLLDVLTTDLSPLSRLPTAAFHPEQPCPGSDFIFTQAFHPSLSLVPLSFFKYLFGCTRS